MMAHLPLEVRMSEIADFLCCCVILGVMFWWVSLG